MTLTTCFLTRALAIPVSSVFTLYNCVMDTAHAKMMSDVLSLLVIDFPYYIVKMIYSFVNLLQWRHGHKRINTFPGRKWERKNNGRD